MSAGLHQELEHVARDHAPSALASSLSAEDMVITDVIARARLPIQVFVIDTGRLHGDTLALVDTIAKRYGIEVTVYAPDTGAVADYAAAHGRDAFYADIELRKLCCAIRKVEPLSRALKGKQAWITGQRREHSASRGQLAEREHDTVRGIAKFNPLAAWTEKQVWEYIRANRVPYNRLYDHGYRSIGCAPCTRPVQSTEDPRAGRWWWEASSKECGLHVAPDGRLVRAKETA